MQLQRINRYSQLPKKNKQQKGSIVLKQNQFVGKTQQTETENSLRIIKNFGYNVNGSPEEIAVITDAEKSAQLMSRLQTLETEIHEHFREAINKQLPKLALDAQKAYIESAKQLILKITSTIRNEFKCFDNETLATLSSKLEMVKKLEQDDFDKVISTAGDTISEHAAHYFSSSLEVATNYIYDTLLDKLDIVLHNAENPNDKKRVTPTMSLNRSSDSSSSLSSEASEEVHPNPNPKPSLAERMQKLGAPTLPMGFSGGSAAGPGGVPPIAKAKPPIPVTDKPKRVDFRESTENIDGEESKLHEEGSTDTKSPLKKNKSQIYDKKPEEKKPDDKKPEEKKPDDKKPDDKKPEDKKPDDKKPEEKKPDDKKPDDKKPEEKKPEEKKPEEKKPDDKKPEEKKVEDKKPEEKKDDKLKREQSVKPPTSPTVSPTASPTSTGSSPALIHPTTDRPKIQKRRAPTRRPTTYDNNDN